jgi:hypothetical protein
MKGQAQQTIISNHLLSVHFQVLTLERRDAFKRGLW